MPPRPPPHAQYQSQLGHLEMGKGGAANGIQNSKLTINDDLSVYGLMLVKRTGQ